MTEPDLRHVLITGVARGIGRATAEAFGAAGWRTTGVDVEALEPPGAVDRFERVDVSDPDAITALLAGMTADGDPLHALVNNAAIQVVKPLADTTLAEWDRVLAVNVRAPFWLIHEAMPLLRATKGAVVNVSSVHAVATSRDICAYATSKGALAAMTRAVALELAGDGVRVNAVLPGAVDTPMLREGISRGHAQGGSPEEQLASFAEGHPMRRVARPAEIAQAILYLADGDRSAYVTGETHVVDGGVTARLSTE